MIQQLTTAAAYREQDEMTTTEMCLLLNCSDMAIKWMKYRNGLAYIRAYLPYDSARIDAFERSKVFWTWWRVRWEMIDYDLINNPDFFEMSIKVRREGYKQAHCPVMTLQEMKPNSVVLAGIISNKMAV